MEKREHFLIDVLPDDLELNRVEGKPDSELMCDVVICVDLREYRELSAKRQNGAKDTRRLRNDGLPVVLVSPLIPPIDVHKSHRSC